jgi:hypothetical protein
MRTISVSNILDESRVHTNSIAGAVLAGICLLIYLVVFFLASDRGFEFSDEAYNLVNNSDPSAFVDVTNSADFWYPFYAAVNGSIPAFRLTGLAILSLCAALFGFNVFRFIGKRPVLTKAGVATILAITACVSWQYNVWKPTPDYNTLNLCALLIFVSGLLRASNQEIPAMQRPLFSRELIGAILVCSIGLTVMALTKATTAVLAALLGLAWVALVRVPRPMASLAITACIAIALLAGAMLLIDGSIAGFVAAKVHAFNIMTSGNNDGDVHGIARSVMNSFSKPLWKMVQALSFTAIFFALALIWSCSVLSSRTTTASRFLPYAAATAISALLFLSRSQDLQVGQPFTGFRLWRLPLAITLAAFALRVLWPLRHAIGRQEARIILAALMLAIAPAAYSFGTGNLLIWHMAGAGIFWVAGMIVLSALAPAARRSQCPQAIAYFAGVTSLALLLSVMTVPGRIGAPLWEQSVPVSLGDRNSTVSVNPEAAEYIGTFQHAAGENGFRSGTPIIDLSEVGLGLSFALGAKPLGAPPWLVTNSGLATEAERRRSVVASASGIPAQLGDVPGSELRRAWVITGDAAYLGIITPLLRSVGVDFPNGYRVVARVTRRDFGSTQVLWKPLH